MRLTKPAILAAAVATASLPAATPAQAQMTDTAQSALTFLQRLVSHYMVLTARSFVDLTYDQLTIEPGTNHLVISGLKLYPVLDWDKEGACEISIDRVVSGETYSWVTVSTGYDVTGVTIPSICFDPMVGQTMAGFGYEKVEVESASIDVAYNLPDSSADLVVNASVTDALNLSLDANFSYLWFNLPMDGYGEPYPVAQLGSAEVVIENRGLWEKLEPMVAQQMGDVNAIPQMIEMSLGQMLAMGGQAPGEAERAVVKNIAEEVGRFLKEKNRIVLTSAPEGGVWLDETAFESPATVIAALQPKASAVPMAYRRIIPPAEMAAALADGANPDEATRLKIGEALVTGVGAPQSNANGARLLMPLAEAWNGKAAALAAMALQDSDPARAYEMALRAVAAGEGSAIGTLDSLEADLSIEEVVAIQESVGAAWPGLAEFGPAFEKAVAEGDVGQIRKWANGAAIGGTVPRSYKSAYMLATLAAAGGDRGAANLRNRLDARFGNMDGWTAISEEAAAAAVSMWTDGGMGAAIVERAK